MIYLLDLLPLWKLFDRSDATGPNLYGALYAASRDRALTGGSILSRGAHPPCHGGAYNHLAFGPQSVAIGHSGDGEMVCV